MELLLNINQYGYSAFLDTDVDVLIIGVKDFSAGYLMTYPLDEISSIIKYVHEKNKKLYLSFNASLNETSIRELEKNIDVIKDLDIDGFVISDFGVLQLFIDNNLKEKVIFNPITTITNKYSAKIANDLGINHVCVANELNINDILEIAHYTNGNIEILAQGYYQICNSKRPLLTLFLKQFKNKEADETKHYYIKEENRDYAYPIMEVDNDLFIFIDKQRTIMPYFKEIYNANINYIRIDTVFLNINEISEIITAYRNVIIDTNNLDNSLSKLKECTDSNYKCLNNISILKKEKENE